MNDPPVAWSESVIRWSVDRPVMVGMVSAAVLVWGVYAFTSMPRDLVPTGTYPLLTMSTRWENTSPEAMEMLVTAPLEEIAGSIKGVRHVSSVSREGRSYVSVEFETGVNIKLPRLELGEKIASFRELLPRDVTGPSLDQYVPEELKSMQGFLSFSLVGQLPAAELRRMAKETVVPRLNSIRGVRTVEVVGGEAGEIRVEFDPDLIKTFGLTIEEMMESLHHLGTNVHVGTLREGSGTHAVVIGSAITGLDELRGTVVARSKNGAAVRLADCAVVRDVPAEARDVFRVNGKPAVSITIDREPGTNMIHVADQVRTSVAGMRADLPSGVEIIGEIDQSTQLRAALNLLPHGIVAAIVSIVCLVLLIYGDFLLPPVILSSILLSLAGTFIVLTTFGLGLNLVTMAGLLLGFGRIVSDAIVVIDRLQHHTAESGEHSGIRPAVREIARPLAASTFMVLCALTSLAFLRGDLRNVISEFALSAGVPILFSLVVSLTFIPAAMNRIGSARHVKRPFPRAGKRSGEFLRRILRRVLKHPHIAFALIVLAVAGCSYFILDKLGSVVSGEYARETYLTVWGEFPRGSTLQESDKFAAAIESEILREPQGVRKLTTRIVDGEVHIRTEFYNDEGTLPLRMKHRLTLLAARTGGTKVSILGFGPGFSSDGETLPGFFVKVSGYNYSRVKEIAMDLRAHLAKNLRIGHVDIDRSLGERENSLELAVIPDRSAIARHGLTVNEFTRAVQLASTGGWERNTIVVAGIEVPLVIQRAGRTDISPSDVRSVALTNAKGTPVRLGDLASFELRRAPGEINREDRQYLRWLSFEYKGPYGVGARFVDESISSIRLPAGYGIERAESWTPSSNVGNRTYASLMGGALILSYMVLASLYESLVTPLIILAAIPCSMIGFIVALLLTEPSLGLPGWAGAFSLAGIAMSNTVVLADHIARQSHAIRMDLEGVVEATVRMFRPILAASLVTLASFVVTLTIDNDSGIWRAWAMGTIGGIVSSTILTPVIIPVFCAAAYRLTGERTKRSGQAG